TMLFLALSDVDLSLQRVAERTKSGGHHVAPAEVTNNFYGNLRYLNQFHHLLNELKIIDTSSAVQPRELLHLNDGRIVAGLPIPLLPPWLKEYLPELFFGSEA
ncbi:MAG: hypothetical protein H7Z75_00480, partial [Ferruginibacter sp.]|nr:hypothetical protein [Cytophagales bacterium]